MSAVLCLPACLCVSTAASCGQAPHGNASVSDATAPDFSSLHGIQDHTPVLVHTQPWPQHQQPEPRCALWNRRDICDCKKKIADLTVHIPYPGDASSVEATYAALSACMLEAMHDRNSKKKDLPKKDIDVTNWSDVVRQLAKQAKRRSKVCYRRVKHTRLTPPSPSTLPTPTRKIQRIPSAQQPLVCARTQLDTQLTASVRP